MLSSVYEYCLFRGMIECLDEDYFRKSEIIIIKQGILGRRPDRTFLIIAQWLEKELL